MVNIFTRVRSATAYEVLQKNPLLAKGEPFYEEDTHAVKFGDGITRYDKLKYAGIILQETFGAETVAQITALRDEILALELASEIDGGGPVTDGDELDGGAP